MSLLELFKGTGSISKVFEDSFDVISLDFNKKWNPDILEDILEWDYKKYPVGKFDVIWASPPCRYYSNLQSSLLGRELLVKNLPVELQRELEGQEKVVWTPELREKAMQVYDQFPKKTLEIVNYLKPLQWFMENPASGEMKNREFMRDIPSYKVDYCRYSNWGYRKPTMIWTNKVGFEAKCCDNGKCGMLLEGTRKHKTLACDTTKQMRYRVPPKLVLDLLRM